MAVALKARGEVECTIAGVDFILRPTFEALVEFEEKAGMSAFSAMRDIAEKQSITAKTVAAAIWAGHRGAARPGDKTKSFAEIGALIQKHGIIQSTQIVFQFLTNALSSEEQLENIQKSLGKAEEETPT